MQHCWAQICTAVGGGSGRRGSTTRFPVQTRIFCTPDQNSYLEKDFLLSVCLCRLFCHSFYSRIHNFVCLCGRTVIIWDGKVVVWQLNYVVNYLILFLKTGINLAMWETATLAKIATALTLNLLWCNKGSRNLVKHRKFYNLIGLWLITIKLMLFDKADF
jgi:hypothetical protein